MRYLSKISQVVVALARPRGWGRAAQCREINTSSAIGWPDPIRAAAPSTTGSRARPDWLAAKCSASLSRPQRLEAARGCLGEFLDYWGSLPPALSRISRFTRARQPREPSTQPRPLSALSTISKIGTMICIKIKATTQIVSVKIEGLRINDQLAMIIQILYNWIS